MWTRPQSICRYWMIDSLQRAKCRKYAHISKTRTTDQKLRGDGNLIERFLFGACFIFCFHAKNGRKHCQFTIKVGGDLKYWAYFPLDCVNTESKHERKDWKHSWRRPCAHNLNCLSFSRIVDPIIWSEIRISQCILPNISEISFYLRLSWLTSLEQVHRIIFRSSLMYDWCPRKNCGLHRFELCINVKKRKKTLVEPIKLHESSKTNASHIILLNIELSGYSGCNTLHWFMPGMR